MWQIDAPPGIYLGAAGVLLVEDLGGGGVAIYRRNDYWLSPEFFTSVSEIPARTVLVLMRDPAGTWKGVVPLLGRDAVVEFEGTPIGLVARVGTGHETTLEGEVRLAVAAEGDDPYALIARLISHAVRAAGTGRLLAEKTLPDWRRWLGGCSWNAFYEKMREQDFDAAIESWVDAPVPLGWMILDDGWQDGDEQRRLVQFAPNAKFPHGLTALIADAKARLSLRAFGVWHTLQGYWDGVSPQSPLADDYEVGDNGLVHPNDYSRFLGDLHAFLAEAGADFIKVDNQGETYRFLRDHYAYVSGMQRLREALETSAEEHFGSSVINCMAQETTVLYQLQRTAVMRNSDDYYPDREQNPEEHILQNAWNALWTRPVAVPDWDMFQSHHPRAWWHAAARAISGGPVYVTDDPGRQDWEILTALTMPDGSIPPCDGYAVPARCSLLHDPRREGGPPLVLFNRAGGCAVLGIFNLTGSGVMWPVGPADAEFEAEHVPGYAVWSSRGGLLGTVDSSQRVPCPIPAHEWDIVVVSPVRGGFAPVGVDGALLPPGWIAKTTEVAGGVQVALRASGPLLVAAIAEPKRVRMAGGEALSFSFTDHLVRCELPRAIGPVEVVLES